MLWPFVEERVALEVDWTMASGCEALLRVREGETPGATCRGGEAEGRVIAVVSKGLAYEPKWVVQRCGEVHVGKVVNLPNEATGWDEEGDMW